MLDDIFVGSMKMLYIEVACSDSGMTRSPIAEGGLWQAFDST